MDWFLASAMGFNVQIEDETDRIAALAFQGPTSCAVLKKMGFQGIENLKPYRFASYPFNGRALMISRTGFTGDLGYELWCDPEQAETLWDTLMESGRNYGIRPFGAQALGMTRIEAGFIQAGVDFVPALDVVRSQRSRSPYELGLDALAQRRSQCQRLDSRQLRVDCNEHRIRVAVEHLNAQFQKRVARPAEQLLAEARDRVRHVRVEEAARAGPEHPVE